MSEIKLITKDDGLYIDMYNKPAKVIKGYESFSGWYWFATEIDHRQDSLIDGKEYPNDTLYFGLVQGHENELGYFSEAELNILIAKGLVWEIKPQDLPLPDDDTNIPKLISQAFAT